MVFYWQTIATYVFGINNHVLQQCLPRQFTWELCQDSVVLGERLPAPGHACTHVPTLLHSLLKCCVLLLSSTTWSKDRCDLAVQTFAPEPESPKSVIQVNSVVEMQSELPVAILPWAMNAPSDSSEGFFKKPKHY